jgi:cell division protein FtsQ
MKRILKISFMVLLLLGVIVLPAFTDLEHTARNYKSFHIDIMNPSENDLITLEEIDKMITAKFGQIEGAPVLGIDLYKLETIVEASPYISKCEVYQTISNGLEMKILVREPLVRIINTEGQQFYLDMHGYAMPLSPIHPRHILVANGKIPDRFVSLDKKETPLSSFVDTSALRQVYPVAWFISKDKFLKSFIDQVYINDKNEMELVPKIGSQVIIFGNAEDAKEKLENLKTFYMKVMSQIDWHVYKSINLKYKNQVVCSKYMHYE